MSDSVIVTGNAWRDELDDRVTGEGQTEVEGDNALEEVQPLDEERLVEVVLRLDLRLDGRATGLSPKSARIGSPGRRNTNA